MEVNFILPGLGDSGGIRVVRKYAELLGERGIDVKIYSSLISPNLHRYPSSIKNRAHQVYCTAKTILSALSRRKKYIFWVPFISDRYIRPADITFATTWVSAYQVTRLSKTRKKAYFIQDFEIWDNNKLGEQSYRLSLEHVVVAKWIDIILVEKLHCKPAYVVHNGIDTINFHPAPARKEERRKKDGRIQCLMLFHELERKGIADGLNAYRIAKATCKNLSLIMFGMPKNPAFDCVDRYYRNPSKERLVELYQTSDIFIFPSREEGWGLTPIEAMACGCAVAGTKTGCMTEIGHNQRNALLSRPNDYESLADNVIRLAEDEALRAALEKGGRATAEECSWEKSTDLFEIVIQEMTSEINSGHGY